MIKKSIFKLTIPILTLPRFIKRSIVLLVDLSLCVLTVWLAYYLRLGEFVALTGIDLWAVGISIGIALPIFVIFGLYRAIFRYSGWPALLAVARAIGVYSLLYMSIFTAIGMSGVPRTVGLIQPILLLLLVGASRVFARIWLGDQYRHILKQSSRPKALIYGAGISGRQLCEGMASNHEMQVIGFLDDDNRLHGQILNGKPIYNPTDLMTLAPVLQVNSVLLALPNINRNRRNEIINQVKAAHVAVRTIPSMSELIQGKVSVSQIRELDIDDLLSREPVLPNHALLSMKVSNKVVMVTGAGGSIGSELCRQILTIGPSKLLLIEQSEIALYNIYHELQEKFPNFTKIIIPLLASVQDMNRINDIMGVWTPDTVYHAAAYKHVPLVEHNPAEGIKNNVLGTLRTAKAAIENKVSDFVLISTDKAVRPTNIMGASKRLAEIILQGLADLPHHSKFSMVRFGNVLGSSGSVVPKFRQQIKEGGPITLTHPEITRYFMTIPEASQLVIQAGAMAKGGDVFVLDMGQPVKIIDLAKRLIEVSGFTVKDENNPFGDIEIEVTGLRPGEKLYEELLIGDNPSSTMHTRIMKAREEFVAWADLQPQLESLELALNVNDITVVRSMMQKLVKEYRAADQVVDWIYLEQEREQNINDVL